MSLQHFAAMQNNITYSTINRRESRGIEFNNLGAEFELPGLTKVNLHQIH